MSDQDSNDQMSEDVSVSFSKSPGDFGIDRSIFFGDDPYSKHLLSIENQPWLLQAIVEKYEIIPRLSNLLKILANFEIVFVIDDSGSMMMNVPNSTRTRLSVIKSLLKIFVEIGCIFVPRGLDLYRLNQRAIHKVRDSDTIDQMFQKKTRGYTPLVPILKHLFNLPTTQNNLDKKLLVVVFTDGEPTDENNQVNIEQLLELMRDRRNVATTCINFVVCNENKDYITTLRSWTNHLQGFAVTDQYEDELSWIRQHPHHLRRLSFGAYLVKVLVSAMHPKEKFYRE